MGSITLPEILIWLVYLTLVTIILWFYRSTKQESYYRYFMLGFGVKVLGGIAFVLIFIFYYGFGDSFLYFRGASILSDAFLDSPGDYFRLLMSDSGQLPPDLYQYSVSISYSNTFEEWFMVKLLSPVALISFKSYLVINLFTSILSFWGAWKLFKVFIDIFPERKLLIFAMVFLLPSVVFWGGGLMKDTVTLWAFNFIVYYMYFMVVHKRKVFISLIWIFFCGFLIFKLKSYILIAMLPGIAMFLYYHYKSVIKSRIVRLAMSPLLLAGIIGVSTYGVFTLSDESGKYSQSELEYKVRGFHSWHTDLGGSAYSLGEVDFTPGGIASKIPAALNVTFFRPYLWESGSVVVLLGALESLIFTWLFIRMLYHTRMRIFRYLRQSNLLMGMLIFCLIFGFAVGFTTYNFGALARYKLPLMSLFGFMMVYTAYRAKFKDQAESEITSS